MERKKAAKKHPQRHSESNPEPKTQNNAPATSGEDGADAAKPPVAVVTPEDITLLHKLSDYMERVNLADYVRLTQKPKRLIGLNFLSGIARGFGMAVGFTLLGAIGLYVLNQLNLLNLPVIGDFIAKIMEYVEVSRGVSI